MTPIEPETVEAARQRVIDWAGSWDEDELPDIQLRADLAALEAAVRAEERARERKRLLDLIAVMLPAQASRVQDMVHALDGPAEGEVTE